MGSVWRFPLDINCVVGSARNVDILSKKGEFKSRRNDTIYRDGLFVIAEIIIISG